jgi:hypothetical protein
LGVCGGEIDFGIGKIINFIILIAN